MSNLTYSFETKHVREIIQDKSLEIPDHQRPEIWKANRQEALIDTIMSGRPMPNLTYRCEIVNSRRKYWLEDGQQRYHAITKFYNNRISWNGRFFRDFTDDERTHFNCYKVCILIYENASVKETIEIFDTFQNGVALSPGHRFWARKNSPAVKYTIDRFMTPGMFFYERMSNAFGPHPITKDTKTKRNLMNAIAITGGLAYGVEFITTSYDILGPKLHNQFDEAAADALMNHVLDVFEAADRKHPLTPKQKKKYWDVGHITGYILASFLEHPDDMEALTYEWTEYLTDIRQETRSIGQLHHNKPASRNWNSERWRTGYMNLFVNPPDEFVNEAESDDNSDEE
jgi:hypothetical protein